MFFFMNADIYSSSMAVSQAARAHLSMADTMCLTVVINAQICLRIWSDRPRAPRDPDAKYVFSGPDEGKGAQMEWSSDNPDVGSGVQEIIESQTNSFVRVSLDFGDMGHGNASFQLKPSGAGTRVVWEFNTDVGNNPLRRWMGLMFDRWIGADYEEGLGRLKKIVENRR